MVFGGKLKWSGRLLEKMTSQQRLEEMEDAWRIPWKEESGELQSMGSQGVRHD